MGFKEKFIKVAETFVKTVIEFGKYVEMIDQIEKGIYRVRNKYQETRAEILEVQNRNPEIIKKAMEKRREILMDNYSRGMVSKEDFVSELNKLKD